MLQLNLQLFGSRGSSGSRSNGSIKTSSNMQEQVTKEIDTFLQELENRNYGTSKKLVPDEQVGEFRRVSNSLISDLKEPDSAQFLEYASGFTYFSKNPEKYLHTTAKLNSYQRLVRSGVKDTKIDLELGIITPERASLELRVYKSIDSMIKHRR